MSPPTTHTQSPLARAWSWSVERSPLLNAYRALVRRNNYPRAQARALIAAANLPDELTRLIDTTVTKTKLWRSERADIAKELIAHTQDALDAGRTPEQIINTFGTPKKVAKLLSRATKRKRPLYWRTLRNIRRAIASCILLIFITYTAMAARFYIGKPNITKNYAVMINAHNDAYTEEEKAWPIYKEVRELWDLHIKTPMQNQIDREYARDIEYRVQVGLAIIPQIPTDHPDYAETVQLFKDFEPQLKRFREATHRPVVGIELGFSFLDTQDNNWSDTTPVAPPKNNPKKNPSLTNMLLPHLSVMRKFANNLAFDALIAARESDNQRTYENISAMLAMAYQKQFNPWLITDLVNIAITNLATKTTAQIIREHPGVLTREHLVALSHELALTIPNTKISLDGERMIFDDILQRAYTDNGNGDGRITKNGLFMLANYEGGWSDSELDANPAQYLAGPAALALIPNRESQTTLYNAMVDTVNTVLQQGPQSIALIENQEHIIEQENAPLIPSLDFSPVKILLPALDRAVGQSFLARMKNQAAATMLAIEIYKLDTGHLPQSLAELTPTHLPELPQDLFNPGQPLKYKVTNTGYLLYSVASDADDDQATIVIEEEYFKFPNFADRYPGLYDDQNQLLLDTAGNPQLAPPTGPDGDWILIDMTPPTKEEPDQSPALGIHLDSIN